MARPNFEDVARQVRTEVEAIPYDHHDGEAAALAVLAKTLGVMYDRGIEDGAAVAVKGTLRINGSPIGILTSLTYVIDQEANYYDATLEELAPSWGKYSPGGPVDMPTPPPPVDPSNPPFEPQPGWLYYVPLKWDKEDGPWAIFAVPGHFPVDQEPQARFASMSIADDATFRALCMTAISRIDRSAKGDA